MSTVLDRSTDRGSIAPESRQPVLLELGSKVATTPKPELVLRNPVHPALYLTRQFFFRLNVHEDLGYLWHPL